MARWNDDLHQIGAMGSHRFGKARINSLADIVVCCVQEERRHRQVPIGLSTLGVIGIGIAIHIPTVGAEEPITLKRGDVTVLVFLSEY